MQGEHSSQKQLFRYDIRRPRPGRPSPAQAGGGRFWLCHRTVSDCPSTWLRAVNLSNRYCPDNGRPFWTPWCSSKWCFCSSSMTYPTVRSKSRSTCTWPENGSRASSQKKQDLTTALCVVSAPGSPDCDARFGRKSATKSFYGYKEHLATDADSELITAVSVTPGNVPDSEVFVPLVDQQAQEVTADKGYDTDENHQKLKQRGQRSSIIVKKNRTNADVIGQANPKSQRERAKIERKFAEQKKYHGLAKARYWGPRRMTIQVLMTCLVVNCKRMVRLREASCAPPRPALCLVDAMGR